MITEPWSHHVCALPKCSQRLVVAFGSQRYAQQITKRLETRETRRCEKWQRRGPKSTVICCRNDALLTQLQRAHTYIHTNTTKQSNAPQTESERGPNLFYIATMRRAPHIRPTNMHPYRPQAEMKRQCKQRGAKKLHPFPENAGAISMPSHYTRPIATQTENEARDKISKSGQITVHQKWR